jgi:hypothetical protein
MAVPYGQARSQSMEFGHHWVVRKLLPDKFDKFPQFFLWNLCLTRYGLVVKIFHDVTRGEKGLS